MTDNETDPFTVFVKMTKDAIPGTADSLQGSPILSDYDLLRLAAKDALGGYPPELLTELFIAVAHEADKAKLRVLPPSASIAIEAVAQYLIATGGWERPAKLLDQRT
jgi:hypothetical protein